MKCDGQVRALSDRYVRREDGKYGTENDNMTQAAYLMISTAIKVIANNIKSSHKKMYIAA